MTGIQLRMIRIDPANRRVEVLENVLATLDTTKKLIGCDCITSVAIDARHIGYCDDYGMYRTPDALGRLPLTWFRGYHEPIVGPIVIVGRPRPGDLDAYETDCQLEVHQVEALIERFGLEPLPPNCPSVEVYSLDKE